MAFNDPRQILADCAADLQMLDLHAPDGTDACETCGGYYPCATFRALVGRHRNRPGFQAGWTEGASRG